MFPTRRHALMCTIFLPSHTCTFSRETRTFSRINTSVHIHKPFVFPGVFFHSRATGVCFCDNVLNNVMVSYCKNKNTMSSILALPLASNRTSVDFKAQTPLRRKTPFNSTHFSRCPHTFSSRSTTHVPGRHTQQ